MNKQIDIFCSRFTEQWLHSCLRIMCTEMIYKPSAFLKSVLGQRKKNPTLYCYLCPEFMMLLLYSAPNTCVSRLSSCLIKTLTVAARAVIHVTAEDNPVISQWCLTPGMTFFLAIFSDGSLYLFETWNSSTNREPDFVPESPGTPGDTPAWNFQFLE